MDKLTDEVRDRAAVAVADTIRRGLSNNAVVDAVAEVLAEHGAAAKSKTSEAMADAQQRLGAALGHEGAALIHHSLPGLVDDAIDVLRHERGRIHWLKVRVAELEHEDGKSYAEPPAKSTARISQEEQTAEAKLLRRLGHALDKQRKRRKAAEANYAHVREQLAAAKALVAEHEANYTHVREQLHERTVETEQLRARVMELQDRSDKRSEEVFAAWQRIGELMRERDAAQRECAVLKRDQMPELYEGLHAQVAELEAERDKARARASAVRGERDDAQRECAELKARVTELERERDTPIPSPGAVKWRKYRELVAKYTKEEPHLRQGQAAYWAARDVDPVWVRTIEDTGRDPFDDDSRIPAFEAELRKAWGVPEGEA